MATAQNLPLVRGTCESLLHQHLDEPLTFAIWADDNFVKTLSNFHSPVVIENGVKRRRRDPATNRRETNQTAVECLAQVKSCCETFHLIDEGNCSEAKCDLAGESHKHGWTPKLAARLFNMHLNDAHKICCSVVEDHSLTTRLRHKPKNI